ncbi:MAG: glycosyltransferase family 9 protein [Janthinobacterium lividum]
MPQSKNETNAAALVAGVPRVSPDTVSPAEPESKRLLLLKFGAIGDVIMAIPAAALMHAAGYAIDWVASETVAPILRLYPWIHVITVNEVSLLRGSGPQRLRHMAALWQELREQQARHGEYDLCATLYYDRRYRLLTLPVRARQRISLSWQDRATRLLPGRHHTDEYARILSGRPDAETPTQLAPIAAPNLPACNRPKVPDRPRIVLVPAGARNLLRDDALRRWAVEHYVAVAEALLARGYEIVLAGGPEDRWASAHFAAFAATAGPTSFADLIGTLSLVATLALLDSADVTLTHDTGPLHLAGITSTAIVTIFGPTDPHGRLPQRANCIALWGGEGFACRPCYDGREYAPCPHNGCMDQVTPAMVLQEVESLLQARREHRALPPSVKVPTRGSLIQLAPAAEARGGA